MINEDVLKIVLNNKSFGKYEAASKAYHTADGLVMPGM